MAYWQGKRKRINPVSAKRKVQLEEYKVQRIEYLRKHKKCEVNDCIEAATDVHHMRGRSGAQLNVEADFLATCRECHVYIEDHPDWARAKGYTRSRLHG